MTIVISSYERREPLLRLLRGLEEQIAAVPSLGQDLEIVVVLDGSTDGSRETVEALVWAVPVRVLWQPNRGLAAARNAGLAAAGGGLVWFLDDDLVPAAGLVDRHRHAHDGDVPSVVVGRCRIPPDVGAPPSFMRWWEGFYDGLHDGGPITRFDRFNASNTSAPASLVRAAGGFDEAFVGYGLEDYELAIRLLAAGTPIRFEGEAVVWHPDVPTRAVMAQRERSVGRNAARIAVLHPDTIETLFPADEVSAPRRLLRVARIRRPAVLLWVSKAAWRLCRLTAPLHAVTSRRAEHLARAAAHAAGVAEGDPTGELLDRLLASA